MKNGSEWDHNVGGEREGCRVPRGKKGQKVLLKRKRTSGTRRLTSAKTLQQRVRKGDLKKNPAPKAQVRKKLCPQGAPGPTSPAQRPLV